MSPLVGKAQSIWDEANPRRHGASSTIAEGKRNLCILHCTVCALLARLSVVWRVIYKGAGSLARARAKTGRPGRAPCPRDGLDTKCWEIEFA